MADRLKVVPESLHAASAEWDGLSGILDQHQVPRVPLSGSGWASAAAVEAVHAGTSIANQVLSSRIQGTASATRNTAVAHVQQEAASAQALGSVEA